MLIKPVPFAEPAFYPVSVRSCFEILLGDRDQYLVRPGGRRT